MRIDPNTRAQQAETSAEAAASNARAATPAAAAGEPAADSARFSLDQVHVQALTAQASSLPEIRQEKVTALGQAVRDGTYQVSPEQTAEAVLSELLARSPAA